MAGPAGMVKKIEYFVAVDEWMYLKPGIWLYHCGRRQQEYSTYNPRTYHVAPWYVDYTWCRFIARKK